MRNDSSWTCRRSLGFMGCLEVAGKGCTRRRAASPCDGGPSWGGAKGGLAGRLRCQAASWHLLPCPSRGLAWCRDSTFDLHDEGEKATLAGPFFRDCGSFWKGDAVAVSESHASSRGQQQRQRRASYRSASLPAVLGQHPAPRIIVAADATKKDRLLMGTRATCASLDHLMLGAVSS